MTDLHFRSATSLVRGLRQGEFSARELLEHFLARIDRLNPSINAVVLQDRPGARARADAADAARARGESLGALHGLPMTVKESYDVAGMPTTWGIPELRDNVVSHDALQGKGTGGGGPQNPKAWSVTVCSRTSMTVFRSKEVRLSVPD